MTDMVDRAKIRNDIVDEERQQEARFGEQNHNNLEWLSILVEEVGDAAMAMNDGKCARMREELIQVAAVCVTWLDCIERRGNESL